MPDKEKVLKWFSQYEHAPHEPGVYWFSDDQDQVLYVGKAKDLKNRLASYTQLKQLHGKTLKMVTTARRLKWEVRASELEALLVEAELIRLHQPQFNILLKDDKTPLYIYITNDFYPQVKTIRKKEIGRLKSLEGVKGQNIFGPYSSAFRTQQVLKLIRPIFRWCDYPLDPSFTKKNRPCFYYHLNRCSGACTGKISVDEYRQDMERLKMFLRGKTKEVLSEFKQEMIESSAKQEYERAAQARDAIQLIEQFMKPTFRLRPDLQLPKLHASLIQEGLLHLRKELRNFYSLSNEYPLLRVECYDVSNIQGKNAAVSMVVFTNGEPDKAEYRLFNIRTLNTPNDYQMMKEALTRRQDHPEWGMPSLIVIDGGKGQLRAALSVWEWDVPVVSLVKDPDRLVIPVFADIAKKSIFNLKYHLVNYPLDHPTLQILQQLRDEAHRFAKKQHTRLRNRVV